MSIKSGVIAAGKSGIPTSSTFQGPKGGKKHMNTKGHEMYGPLPTGHKPVYKPVVMPVVGNKLQIPVEGLGWKTGVVVKVYPKKEMMDVKLDSGEGVAEAGWHDGHTLGWVGSKLSATRRERSCRRVARRSR
jgi:hypothetical protein